MKLTDIPKPIRDKLIFDEFVCGSAFCLKHADGTFERIDPCKVVLNLKTKEYEILEEK